MAWTAPATTTTGQIITSAFWNQQIKGNMDVLSSALLMPIHLSTYEYSSQGAVVAAAAMAITANFLYAVPIAIPNSGTYSAIQCNCGSGATGNVRMGIFADNAGVPGVLTSDAGAMAVVSNANRITGLSISLTGPGKYWLACLFSGAPTMEVLDRNDVLMPAGANGVWVTNQSGVSAAQAYGALPDPFPASVNYIRAVRLSIRRT